MEHEVRAAQGRARGGRGASSAGEQVAPGQLLVRYEGECMMSKTVVTCALTGVLTDPAQHHVPVTPEQMAREARAAFDAGASVMHVHFRQQAPGHGAPAVLGARTSRSEIAQAIREACPGVIFNQSTGVVGPDISGPVACMRAIRPEIAACNAGSLNYLKVKQRRHAGRGRRCCSTTPSRRCRRSST